MSMSIFLLETPGLGRSGKDDMLGKRGCSPDIVDEEGVETDLPLSLGERSVAARKRTAFHKRRRLDRPHPAQAQMQATEAKPNGSPRTQTHSFMPMRNSSSSSTPTRIDGRVASPSPSSPLHSSTPTRYSDSLTSPFSTLDLENINTTSFTLLDASDASDTSLIATPADRDRPPAPHLLGPEDLAVLSPLDLAGCPQSTPIRRRGGLRPSSSFGKKGGMSCYEYGAHDSIGPYGPGAVGYREGDEYRDASRLSWEDSSDEGDSGRDVRVTMVHTSDDDPSPSTGYNPDPRMISTRNTSHLSPRSPLSPLSPLDLRRLQLTTSTATRPPTRRGLHPTPEAPRSLLVKRLFGATTRWSDDDVSLVRSSPTPIPDPSLNPQLDLGDVGQSAPPHANPFTSGFDPIVDFKQEHGALNPPNALRRQTNPEKHGGEFVTLPATPPSRKRRREAWHTMIGSALGAHRPKKRRNDEMEIDVDDIHARSQFPSPPPAPKRRYLYDQRRQRQPSVDVSPSKNRHADTRGVDADRMARLARRNKTVY